MFSPLELEKIEFAVTLWGHYKRDSVDEIFALIVNDYTTLYKENIAYKDKISMLDDLVKKYKAMEDTMNKALLLAQTASDSAISAANEKAGNILKESEERAAAMNKEAEEEQRRLLSKAREIKRSISAFAAKQISLLKSQIEILEQMASDSISGENAAADNDGEN